MIFLRQRSARPDPWSACPGCSSLDYGKAGILTHESYSYRRSGQEQFYRTTRPLLSTGQNLLGHDACRESANCWQRLRASRQRHRLYGVPPGRVCVCSRAPGARSCRSQAILMLSSRISPMRITSGHGAEHGAKPPQRVSIGSYLRCLMMDSLCW